jgi:hypothetical protein
MYVHVKWYCLPIDVKYNRRTMCKHCTITVIHAMKDFAVFVALVPPEDIMMSHLMLYVSTCSLSNFNHRDSGGSFNMYSSRTKHRLLYVPHSILCFSNPRLSTPSYHNRQHQHHSH